MKDEDTQDKQLDKMDAKPDGVVDEISGLSKDGDEPAETAKPLEDELPEKSDVERELERVESIESKDYVKEDTEASDDSMPEESEDTQVESSAESETSEYKGPVVMPITPSEDEPKKVTIDDVIKRTKDSKTSDKKVNIWMILALLLFVVAAGVGAMYYLAISGDNSELAALQSSVDSKQRENVALAKQLTDAQKSLADKIDAEQKQQESVKNEIPVSYRDIPEWAVRYKIVDTNKDLTYMYTVIDEGVDALSFSTVQITALKDATNPVDKYPCSSSSSSVGRIVRYTNAALEAAKKEAAGTPFATQYDKAVKVGSYSYIVNTPQNACSTNLGSTNYKDILKVVQDLPNRFEAIPSK